MATVMEGEVVTIDSDTGEIISPHTTDLSVVSNQELILPTITPEEMKASLVRWNELKEAVLDAGDWQWIGRDKDGRDRKFIKKSGWEKLSMCFSVSVQVLDFKTERDLSGQVLSAEVHARATAPNGRYEDGVAACDISEERFEKASARKKVHHDILATAETRARNRACSNLFGHGEVSYEEAQTVSGESPDYGPGAGAEGPSRPVAPSAGSQGHTAVAGPPCPKNANHIMVAKQRKNDGKGGPAGSWYWKCPKRDENRENGWCNGYRNYEDGEGLIIANPVHHDLSQMGNPENELLPGPVEAEYPPAVVYQWLLTLPRENIPFTLKMVGLGKEDLVKKLEGVKPETLEVLYKLVQTKLKIAALPSSLDPEAGS